MAARRRYFPQLDGLRALAALMVLFHHYCPAYAALDPTHGRLGVDIFFLLSGFLITRSLRRAPEDSPAAALKSFHERRIRRIIPVYYLTLFLYLWMPMERSGVFFWHLAFLSNFYFIAHQQFIGAGGHLWALAVEQQFYLFWPLIVLWAPRNLGSVSAIAMIGTGVLFRLIGGADGWSDLTLNIMTPSAFEPLGAGAFLACWMEGRETTPQRRHRWISTLGGLGLALVLARWLLGDAPTGRWTSLLTMELSRSLCLAWILAQAVWGIPGWIGRALASAPARALGAWSYSIYLSHNLFYGIFHETAHHLGPLSVADSQALLALAATLVWSSACYYAIEKPLLNGRPSSAKGAFALSTEI